jgi:hypothetical protein
LVLAILSGVFLSLFSVLGLAPCSCGVHKRGPTGQS